MDMNLRSGSLGWQGMAGTSSTTLAAIDPLPNLLLLAISAGGSVKDRFRVAWHMHLRSGASPQRGRDLATALNVHPSALSPSNFKLTASALAAAAKLFGVSEEFLIHGELGPGALPAWMERPCRMVALARKVGERVRSVDSKAPPLWDAAAVWVIVPLERISALAITPAEREAVELVGPLLRDQAEAQGAAAPTLTLPATDWHLVLECLSNCALATPTAALDDPRLRLAARIHAALERRL